MSNGFNTFVSMKKRLLIFLLAIFMGYKVCATKFELPAELKPNVQFWEKIYAEYESDQVIFFDEKDLTVVYHIMKLPPVRGQISSQKYKDPVKKKFEKIKKIISNITNNKPVKKNKDLYKEVYEVLKKKGLHKNGDMANRLRYQNGLKGQFKYGLKKSGRYEKEIRAILKFYDLPFELIGIVFVESLFYLPAVSYAGAGGPWGLLEETAQMFGIEVNPFIDERFDPIISTWGAAKYLKKAYEGLDSWPLAILSYNYGYPGTLRAQKKFKTKDIAKIIKKHESPIFGFASKNYYAEFLAALNVYKNQDEYFNDLKKEKPWSYELVEVLRPLDVKDLYKFNVLDKADLNKYNPSLTKRTLKGKEVIPPNFSLRVKKGYKNKFYEKLKKIPAVKRRKAGYKISTRYKTKGSESLIDIADKNSIRAEFLANKLNKSVTYEAVGTIIIRSQAYRFSPIKNVVQNAISALTLNI